MVVVLSSLTAVGALQFGSSNFGGSIFITFRFRWLGLFDLFVGVKVIWDVNTKTNHGELLRTIGFAQAPGIIKVFGFTPDLMVVTFIGSGFWILACMVVAVKSALELQ